MKKNPICNAVLPFLIFLCVCLNGFSQQIIKKKINLLADKNSKNDIIRCGTTENEERLQIKNQNRLTKSQFENWLSPLIEFQKQKKLTNRTEVTIFTIPVVIHIIHNGDAINTNSSHATENISDSQAASQITVLNQDFRRIFGTRGFGTTGYNRGVDCQINFVLAKQDPYGVLTNGIEHLNMKEADWSSAKIDEVLKPNTIWDPTKYLNIWTVRFSPANNLLGFAQFPSNSNLGGLNTSGGEANSDGVVINYNAFGSRAENDGSFELNKNYNLGRTTTHEIGHFLGLRHIWGDDDECTGNNSTLGDYVSDTPDSTKPNYSCETIAANCIGFDMVENYMDYSTDSCLDTFTPGQKTRMTAVMLNSPRRIELATSIAANPGFIKTFDAALRNISLTTSTCNSSITPAFYIVNKGTTTLQTAVITYSIDNLNPKKFEWNGNLSQNNTEFILLPEISLSSGAHIFSTEITTINNTADLNTLNDSTSKSFTIPPLSQLVGDTTPKVTLKLQCDRDGSETTWAIRNSIGTTIYSGGPYVDASSSTNLNTLITEVFSLQDGQCYTFTIFDSYGDGINTNGGIGSYTLEDENNTVFATGGTFLFNESKGFTFGTLSTSSYETSNEIYVYPNPVRESLNINLPNFIGLPNSYTIINSLGKIIRKKEVNKEIDLNVNISSLSKGVYFISIKKDNQKRTFKFIKE